MPEFESSYQQVTGRPQIENVLKGKVSAEIIEELSKQYEETRVGIIEALKSGGHISEPFMRAKQLAKISHLPQVVIFNHSYFAISPSGECSGPLANECQPDADTAKNWAATALKWGDVSLLASVNAMLPERPKEWQ